MTTYNWSALTNGQTIATFNPNVDVLNFNDATISAAALFIDADDTVVIPFISFSYAGKTVIVNMNPLSTTTINVTFANGSMFLVGDNATGTVGDDGVNTLTGGAGNDLIVGVGGADILSGGDGNDVFLMPGTSAAGNFFGNDTINGGNGVDRLEFSRTFAGITVNLGLGTATTGDGPPASTLALSNIENVFGTQHSDTIAGNSSDNEFRGRAGNDVLNGGLGKDTADYGSALSGVVAELWRSLVSNDGEGGVDTLVNMENLTGSAFNDTLAGDGNNNVFKGGAGFDVFYGGGGVDTADYSSATAFMTADLSVGITGTDGQGAVDNFVSIENLIGSAFNDIMVGDANANTLRGGAGNDILSGGGGLDTADYCTTTTGVVAELWRGLASNDGQGGSDTLVNMENLTGSAFNDTLAGDNNSNVFKGGAGTDAFFGGGGIDTADYSEATAGMTVDLGAGVVGSDGQGGGDNLFSIENITGSAFADIILGDANANQIEGGTGNDNMVGGGSADAFVFRTGSNIDNIFDFLKVQGDKIHLQSNLNGSGITTAAQALAATVDVAGGNAAVFLGGLNAVTLVGVTTASLTASDFVIF
jgi:Ca2+-binding RTX toxin-like protein